MPRFHKHLLSDLPRHWARPFVTGRARAAAAFLALFVSTVAQGQSPAAPPDTGISFIAPPAPVVVPPPASEPAPTTTESGSGLAGISPTDISPPSSLHDPDLWLEYKQRLQLPALPDEARIFFRRGLMAHQAGSRDEALRWVRAAATLDPSFVQPRLTLGSWMLLREPGSAMAHFASVVEVARQSFSLQLSLFANTEFALLQSLFLGLIATAVLIVLVRGQELRHRWQEFLRSRISRRTTILWSWIAFVGPFFVGLGPALPALVFLGLLWPLLRWGERTIFILLAVSLVGMPWCIREFDRLGSPLREEREPLFGVLRLQNEPYSPALAQRIERIARTHPDNGLAQFAHGWVLRRGGDLPGAEAAYRRTLEIWPDDDRVLNNLGNVLGLMGQSDEALRLLSRSTMSNALSGTPHFNRARILTERYEFAAAQDALAKASALNFDLLNPGALALRPGESMLPMDLWIAPARMRAALDSYRAPAGALLAVPPAWRTRIECSGWRFSVLALLATVASLAAGIYAHRRMPVRHCGNCQRVICRRCTRRRREIALCRECSETAARATSGEFIQVLLLDRQRQVHVRRRAWRAAWAATIPGLGLILHRRTFRALSLLVVTAALATFALGAATPFSYEPRLHYPQDPAGLLWLVLPWAAIYVLSIWGYFDQVRREGAKIDQSLAAARRERPARLVKEAA